MSTVRQRVNVLAVAVAVSVIAVSTPAYAAFHLERVEDAPQIRVSFVGAVPRTLTPTVGRQAVQDRPAPRLSLPPAHVITCESKGSYTAENPTSTASGKYQIVDGTWGGYGGFSHAADAPPHIQDQRAAQIWANGAGKSHWKSCL